MKLFVIVAVTEHEFKEPVAWITGSTQWYFHLIFITHLTPSQRFECWVLLLDTGFTEIDKQKSFLLIIDLDCIPSFFLYTSGLGLLRLVLNIGSVFWIRIWKTQVMKAWSPPCTHIRR